MSWTRVVLPILAIGLHAMAIGGWVSLAPRGFGWTDARTLINVVFPGLALAIAFASLGLAYARRAAEPLAIGVVCFATMWLGAGIANRAIFPVTGLWSVTISALVATIVLTAIARPKLATRRSRTLRAPTAAASMVGGVMGFASVALVRAPDPGTHPLDVEAEGTPHDGTELRGRCGLLRVGLTPFLTFAGTSRDRYWSLFESQAASDPVWSLDALTSEEQLLSFTAYSVLDRPVFAHLSSFTTIQLEGGSALALSFDGPDGTVTSIQPADYPGGRPIRFAYLEDEGVLRVVEASDGEKGPYRELARSRLGRQGGLSLDVFDAGAHMCSFTFEDWAPQASTQTSPTAGWDVPVNAVSFQTGADLGAATITLSLAATGIGRGFDTVGHAPGVYRNRVRMSSPRPAVR